MITTDIAVAAFVVAVALYGIVDAVYTPIKVRRFYTDNDYNGNSANKQLLTSLTDSSIVSDMYTNCVYEKSPANGSIKQCKAWSVNRRKFTLAKAVRKRNQTPWSITIIDSNDALAECKVQPTIVPEAIQYIGDGKSIELARDEVIANRYHVVTEYEQMVVPLVTQQIRKYLLQTDVIYFECTANQVIVKRHWNSHQVLERLEADLDAAQQVAGAMAML